MYWDAGKKNDVLYHLQSTRFYRRILCSYLVHSWVLVCHLWFCHLDLLIKKEEIYDMRDYEL
jgi:hypothetical protein